jgi:hypothetical protein
MVELGVRGEGSITEDTLQSSHCIAQFVCFEWSQDGGGRWHLSPCRPLETGELHSCRQKMSRDVRPTYKSQLCWPVGHLPFLWVCCCVVLLPWQLVAGPD